MMCPANSKLAAAIVVAATVVIGGGMAVDEQMAQAEPQTASSSRNGPPITLTAENDGVKFEVIVAERSGELPETKEGERTRLDLRLRITNQTGRAFRLGRYRTTGVTMQSTSDKPYGIKTRRELRRGALREPTLADFPLVEPGQSITLNAYWRDSALRLGEANDYHAGSWVYRGLEAGEYELRLSYIGMVRDIEVLGDDGATVKIPKEEMWHGSVQSPPIKVTLAALPATGGKAKDKEGMDEDQLCQKLEDCYESVRRLEKRRGPAFDMDVERLSYLVLVARTHSHGSQRLDTVFSRIQKESPTLAVPHFVMTPAELERFIDRLATDGAYNLVSTKVRYMSEWIAGAKNEITRRSGFKFDPSVPVIYGQ